MAGEGCIPHTPPPGPWYATKRLFASFVIAIFRKNLQGLPMAKSVSMVWGPHIARVKTKKMLILRISLFKAPLSYVD